MLLALADDEICLGHWYATWMGLGPFLEEDLATMSIAQDELGHARALYVLVEPDGDLDAVAYGRPAEAYRSSWLAEDACPTWEELFVRHLLYDEAEIGALGGAERLDASPASARWPQRARTRSSTTCATPTRCSSG